MPGKRGSSFATWRRVRPGSKSYKPGKVKYKYKGPKAASKRKWISKINRKRATKWRVGTKRLGQKKGPLKEPDNVPLHEVKVNRMVGYAPQKRSKALGQEMSLIRKDSYVLKSAEQTQGVYVFHHMDNAAYVQPLPVTSLDAEIPNIWNVVQNTTLSQQFNGQVTVPALTVGTGGTTPVTTIQCTTQSLSVSEMMLQRIYLHDFQTKQVMVNTSNLPITVKIFELRPLKDLNVTAIEAWEGALQGEQNSENPASTVTPKGFLPYNQQQGLAEPGALPFQLKQFQKQFVRIAERQVTILPGDTYSYLSNIQYNQYMDFMDCYPPNAIGGGIATTGINRFLQKYYVSTMIIILGGKVQGTNLTLTTDIAGYAKGQLDVYQECILRFSKLPVKTTSKYYYSSMPDTIYNQHAYDPLDGDDVTPGTL